MGNLSKKIELNVYGISKEIVFDNTEQIIAWVGSERPFWEELQTKLSNSRISIICREQINFYNLIINEAERFNEINSESDTGDELERCIRFLEDELSKVSDGRILTSDLRGFDQIKEIANDDARVAALLLVTNKGDVYNVIRQIGSNNLTDILIALPRYLSLSKNIEGGIQERTDEISFLIKTTREQQSESQTKLASITELLKNHKENSANQQSSIQEEWNSRLEEINSQWEESNKIFNEQLALQAPAIYWNTVAQKNNTMAIIYASVFGGFLAAAIGLFIWLGIPHLLDLSHSKGISPILGLSPVVIPALAVMWVLRILGRQLSESILATRDAKEREVMTRTYLALMKSGNDEKPPMEDNDRQIVLQSLFRPSSITGNDDAPPFSITDIFSKFSGK